MKTLKTVKTVKMRKMKVGSEEVRKCRKTLSDILTVTQQDCRVTANGSLPALAAGSRNLDRSPQW